MEGSGDGRVMSKAKGTGGGRCNRKSRLGKEKTKRDITYSRKRSGVSR